MVNSEDFAKRLQIIMEFYGLSSSGLADEIDFNRSSISHLLSGRNKPSLEFVMKILEKFEDVKLYWLLNGQGSFPNPELELDLPKEIKNVAPVLEIVENKTLENSQQSLFTNVNTSQNIERVIIFYQDGTFKEYKN